MLKYIIDNLAVNPLTFNDLKPGDFFTFSDPIGGHLIARLRQKINDEMYFKYDKESGIELFIITQQNLKTETVIKLELKVPMQFTRA